MRAVILQSNQQLHVDNILLPSPAPDECSIRVAAVGICSSDIFRSCDHGAYFYPLIMGHELSGEIVEVGESVKGKFKTGDKVAVYPLIPCQKCDSCINKSYVHCKDYNYYGSRRHGGFAEYLNVHAWNLIRLPETLNLEKAAALEPLSVCIHALRKADLFTTLNAKNELPPQTNIAILGAGFLGLLTAKLLKWIHPKISVTLIDRNSFKLEKNTCGMHENICLKEKENWASYINENSGRFSHVIESCGAPDTFRYSIELAKQGGCVIWMGNIFSDLDIPKKMVSSILRKEISIKGTWNSNYDPDSQNDWTTAIDILNEGFEFESLISERIGLDDLPDRMMQLYSHKSRKSELKSIKIFVIPSLHTNRS